jgi:hypothetical protein
MTLLGALQQGDAMHWSRRLRGIDLDPSCAHTRKLKPRSAVSHWWSTICPFFLQALEPVAKQKDPLDTFMLLAMGGSWIRLLLERARALPMR